MLRFLLGKVDMPYFEVVLTTKCTLRCEACSDMMQYSADSHQPPAPSLAYGELALRAGQGEPLLAPVRRFLRESSKVKSFDIVTNATLDFKEDLLEELAGVRKAWVTIDQ